MGHVYDLLGIVNAVVLLLALVVLLLGAVKKFWVVLVYVAWELFASAALTIADFRYNGSAPGTRATETEAQRWYARLYWTNDVVVDLLRFLLVIVLIYMATSGSARLPAVRRLLVGVVVATVVLPFLLFPLNPAPWPASSWFNSTSELLNFGAAIMNLVLWTALIASRRRDPQLMRVSAGLGVVVTGAAVSYGLRHLIPQGALTSVPNLFLMLTQLAGWTIWCWAFWPAKKPRRVPAESLKSIEGQT